MDNSAEANKFVAYIRNLPDFALREEISTYNHIGATLTDVIFQPGINYETAVKPRVNKIRSYGTASMISGIQSLFRRVDAEDFFHWKGRKPRDFLRIVNFFARENVETEEDLKTWMLNPANVKRLKLQSGFGNKTADYLKILVGIPSVAVDRHLVTMLERAGIITNEYAEARSILFDAAQMMGINLSALDQSIWWYIRNENKAEPEYED